MDGPAPVQGAHADAWYTTGAAHVVGQDYAAALDGPPGHAFAVVCDGCSGSPDTDIGARLLAHAALAEHAATGPVDAHAAVWRAWAAAAAVALPASALDATLVCARVRPGTLDLALFGDGVAAARQRDGAFQLWVASHPHGAPRYPSYALDPGRRRAYLDTYGATWTLQHRAADGQWTQSTMIASGHCWSLDPDRFDLVLVGSDGLQAFAGPRPDHSEMDSEMDSAVAVETIVAELLAMPALHGRFAARRGRRFITKTCPARHWRPVDDVGFAAIALGTRAGATRR